MKPLPNPKPCRVCGEPVLFPHGLMTRVHRFCLLKEKSDARPDRKPLPAYKLVREPRSGTTNPSLDIAKGNHRDRKLLDLAHEVHTCTNCDAWVEHGCDPCHENGIEAGKGQSIKSQDHRHFAGCGQCHSWYDSGIGWSPCGQWAEHEKQQMFDRAHKRTFDIYWRNGWIKVAA